MVLARRCSDTIPHIRGRKSISTLQDQVSQRPNILRWITLPTTCNALVISIVVLGWICVPKGHSESVPWMVDAIQLYHQCWPGRWTRDLDHCYHCCLEPDVYVVPKCKIYLAS